jgi:hypothetical protein
MILDESLSICKATAVSAAAGTALVGNQIDLGVGERNPLRGVQPLYLVLTIDVAFTSGGAATVNFQLVSDAQVGILTDGTATVHYQTGAIALAGLTLRRRWIVPLPWSPDTERFLGLLVVTAAATTTAGSITAEITAFPPSNYAPYPDAVN